MTNNNVTIAFLLVFLLCTRSHIFVYVYALRDCVSVYNNNSAQCELPQTEKKRRKKNTHAQLARTANKPNWYVYRAAPYVLELALHLA